MGRVLFQCLICLSISGAAIGAARENMTFSAVLARTNQTFQYGTLSVRDAKGISPCIDFLARPLAKLTKGMWGRLHCALVGVTRTCTFVDEDSRWRTEFDASISIQLTRGLYNEMGRLIDEHKHERGVERIHVRAWPQNATILFVKEVTDVIGFSGQSSLGAPANIYRIEETEVEFTVTLFGTDDVKIETRVFRRNLKASANEDLVGEEGFFDYR